MDNLKEIAELIQFASRRLDRIGTKMLHKSIDATDLAIRDDADFILRQMRVTLENMSSDIHRLADHVSTSTPIEAGKFLPYF